MNCCHGQECSAALPGSPARAGADRQPDHQPGSKLATIRALSLETASSSLGRLLTLGTIEERETYAALDWLGAQHDHVERTPSHAGRRSPCLSPSANRVTAAHHHALRSLGKGLFAEGFLAGNHENRIVGHQCQDSREVTALTRCHPRASTTRRIAFSLSVML
jgi:hypothetical protein